MVKRGYFVSGLIVAIPAFGWLAGFDFSGMAWWQIVAVIGAKTSAFAGIMLLALSLIMSGRYVIYSRLFGGLDKMYKAHQFFGIWGTVLLFLHPLALSLGNLDRGIAKAFSIWLGQPNVNILLGAAALYLLIGLVIWSKYARVRYETFVKVHRLLGIVFLLGALHAFLAGSVLANNPFIFVFVLIFVSFAMVSFLLYSILGDLLHRPIKYVVEDIIHHSEHITEVILYPKNRILSFSPGQFVYVSFVGLEEMGYHPFSIASGKTNRRLRLIVRRVGDFTGAIEDLQKNVTAKVKGPYGGFLFSAYKHKKQLWIAGGIGITPFLSGAHSKLRSYSRSQIEMVYATSDKVPFAADELQMIEERDPSFNVTFFHQEKFGFVSLATLKEHMYDFDEREIYICGPPPMLKALITEAHEMGIHHRLHYEEFSY